jgi:hypothetical protein
MGRENQDERTGQFPRGSRSGAVRPAAALPGDGTTRANVNCVASPRDARNSGSFAAV